MTKEANSISFTSALHELFDLMEKKIFKGPAETIYKWVGETQRELKAYPIAVTVTATAFAALGFCITSAVLNQIPFFCIKRYLLKASEWTIGGVIIYIVHNALKAMAEIHYAKSDKASQAIQDKPLDKS